MDKKQKILLIIAGIFVFVLGGGMGVYYQKQNVQIVSSSDLPKTLASKTISVHAGGTVTKIDKMNITLSSGKDQLIVPVNKNAKVSVFTSAQGSYQPDKFSDVKVGDILNIDLQLSSDGKLQGQSVYIFRPAPAPTSNKSKGSPK